VKMCVWWFIYLIEHESGLVENVGFVYLHDQVVVFLGAFVDIGEHGYIIVVFGDVGDHFLDEYCFVDVGVIE